MDHLKYPIGKFEYGKSYTAEDNLRHIAILEAFPKELRTLVSGFTPSQFDNTYRPEGWTARQIIHHIADSHLNAYIRLKLSLTEDKPVIKPYNQDLWASLPDGKNAPVDASLNIIDAVHQRWTFLLRTLNEQDFRRTYIHPEYQREFRLNELLALYAWHGRQHYEHLKIISAL